MADLYAVAAHPTSPHVFATACESDRVFLRAGATHGRPVGPKFRAAGARLGRKMFGARRALRAAVSSGACAWAA